MRALLMMYGSRGEVEPMEFAVPLRAEECDAPLVTGLMPTGGC